MEIREAFPIKFVALLFSTILLSCHSDKSIPNRWVEESQLDLQQGKTYFHQRLYSGYVFRRNEKGDTLMKSSFWNGREEGCRKEWYSADALKEIRYYKNGDEEGNSKGWYSNGQLKFDFHFVKGEWEGPQQEWYANGGIRRLGHYHQGKEDGSQRLYWPDGSLQMNYITKNGRNYGNTGYKNCSSQDSSSIRIEYANPKRLPSENK